MNSSFTNSQINAIRGLYLANAGAKGFFDHVAQRAKDSRETTVERAAQKARSANSEMLDAFRKMEDAGIGRVIIGRRGAKTRFSWDYSLRSVGKVARGEASQLETVDPAAEITDDFDEYVGTEITMSPYVVPMISHDFQLRPDMRISIGLPQDLTSKEASRLSSFLESLPFSE